MDYQQRLKLNTKLFYFTSISVALAFIIPIWVVFQRRFMSFEQIALVYASASAMTTILELPTGALADLIGRKKTLIIAWTLSALAYIFMAFAQNFYYFFFWFMINSIANALDSGSSDALLFDSLKELNKEHEYANFNTKYGFIYRLGLSFACLMGGYLFNIWVGLPYLLTGIFSLLVVILYFFMIEPKIDSEKFSLQNYLKQTKIGFKQLYKTNFIRILSIYFIVVGAITWTCLNYYNQPFAVEVGFNDIERSWLFSAIYLFVASLLLVLVSLSKKHKIDKKWIYLTFPVVIIVALIPGFITIAENPAL
ncbi:MFS transporter [Candidatus Beckwithbacteria bacterium]|nr:MFS transporter [Candidatus Beckwithbacteria bacterium]